MRTEVYNIEGMACAACSSAVERVTRKLEGVQSSDVNLTTNKMVITYDESRVTEQMIVEKVDKAGFKASLVVEEADKKKQEYEILLGQKRKKELEIHEIELAMKAIEEAASQVQKTFGQELNEKISEIFCDMTNGKYTQAVMDENFSMMVYDGFDHVDMKYLSNATVEQLYFALRLASADLLYENDAFPLFLDDVFGNYDDERLAQTMQYLSHHTDRQIFLFTGRKEILRLLDEKEILYHLISL